MLRATLQAEVTGGGIPLSELNCASCESRKLPVRRLNALMVSKLRATKLPSECSEAGMQENV